MYKLFFIIFLSISLFANEQKTEKIDYVNEMTILVGDSENGFEQNIDRSLAYQLQFQYNDLDFPIKPEIAFVYSQDIPLYTSTEESSTRYSLMMVNGVYEIPYSDLLTPYVKGGVGYVSFANVKDSPDSTPLLDTGAGVKLHLSDRWALKFEAVALFGADHFNLLATGGVNFAFGRKYVAPPPEKVCEPCEVTKTVYITKEPVKTYTPKNIRFEFAKATLPDDSKASFKDFADELNSEENRQKEILIIGNTDNKGTGAFNATLAIKRANAVRTELIINDVNASRISIDGLGETNPIADNTTEVGREKNRRVIVILQRERTLRTQR